MNTTILRPLSIAAGLAGLITLAGAPAMAAAAPIGVVSCRYSSTPRDGAQLIPAMAPLQADDVQITFVNHAPLAATDVRFAVSYAGRTQVFDDRGTFSTGASVTQDFNPSSYLQYNGPATCTVQSVTFSDGSSWQPM